MGSTLRQRIGVKSGGFHHNVIEHPRRCVRVSLFARHSVIVLTGTEFLK